MPRSPIPEWPSEALADAAVIVPTERGPMVFFPGWTLGD